MGVTSLPLKARFQQKEVSKNQIHLPSPSHVEEEDEIVEEYFSVDWAFPLIYDIYPEEDNLLDEVGLSVDKKRFVDESPKSDVSKLHIEDISFVDFLGIDIKFLCWFHYVGGQFEFQRKSNN